MVADSPPANDALVVVNSRQVGVKAGQTLVGSLEFLPLRDAYNLTQRCGCAPPGHLGRRVILTENRSNDSGISV